jgi:tripartite-type tricarboxylate transporter receptor subunit TctC
MMGELAIALMIATSGAIAQSPSSATPPAYPMKPIRLIIPAPPGGGTDFLARGIIPKMSEYLGQPVVIENRGGAGGNIATEMVAKAPHDGYTIIFVNTGFAVAPALYKNLRFDPLLDFEPITLLMKQPLFLVVHPSLPVKSVSELIELAKTKPGQLNFASSGTGQSAHLAGELLKSMANVNIVHIPYNGGGPALQDTLAGQVTLHVGGIVSVLPHIRAGKLRALGSTSMKRARVLPDVPTIAEAALPGFEAVAWYGALAPAGTPKEILDRLWRGISLGLESPEMQKRIMDAGGESEGSSPDQFRTFVRSEATKWAEVARASGLRPE